MRISKEKSHKKQDYNAQMQTRRNWPMTVLLAATVIALLFSLFNATYMNQGLHRNTQTYGDQITTMLAGSIRAEIENGINGMKNIADSVTQLSIHDAALDQNEELFHFLSRKAAIHNLDCIIMANVSKEYLIVTPRSLDVKPGELLASKTVQNAVKGRASVGAMNGSIFYAAPVQHGAHNDVLVGVLSRAKLQEIIDGRSFGGESLSCIVNADGTHVVAPSDLFPFLYLDEVYQRGEISAIDEMLKKEYGSSIFYQDKDGTENLLSCDPLGISDWRLLSIVPTDLIRGNTRQYLANTFLIVIGFAVLFLLLLLVIFRTNRHSRKQLYTLAYEDNITKGLNGPAFRVKYRSTLPKTKPFCRCVAMLNIRNFRLVNERLGFGVGDDVLRLVHDCITCELDEARDEFVGRSETDHFFICMAESDAHEISKRLKRMTDDMEARIEMRNLCYPLQILGGCCIAESAEQDVQILKERARIAERDNRPEYERCLFYNGEIVSRLEREAELEFAFRDALKNGEFEVYLQPKIELVTNRPMGAEALIRWKHPVRGMISPAEFVPLFEKNGKICKIDFFVFQKICELYQTRQQLGKPWYPISVNLSKYHFYEEDFLDTFIETAKKYELPPGALEFELTESMFFDKERIEQIKETIRRMHEAGFLCSIDDFGIGYSSLSMLKAYEVDTLKMDRTFFLDADTQKAQDIIKSVVELTKKLNMQTVAEGIETFEQVEFLRSIGCNAVQGFCFSKPLPVSEFEQWVLKYEQGHLQS